MARIRSIKPEFWGDRKLAKRVGRDARLFYIALWNQADEWARVNGDAQWLKGHCFPYDDDLDIDTIATLVNELAEAGRITRYSVEGDPYLFLPKLAEHQRLEPTKVASKLPDPAHADPSEPRADKVAPDSDDPEKIDALHVAGSMEHVAGSMGVALRADEEPPDDPTSRLVTEHVAAYDQPPPPSAIVPVKREVMRLVAERIPEDRIRAGLARLRDKRVAASLLPQLVAECAQVARPSTTDQRVATGLALVEKYREAEGR